jgi:hypothetical protein
MLRAAKMWTFDAGRFFLAQRESVRLIGAAYSRPSIACGLCARVGRAIGGEEPCAVDSRIDLRG